VKDMSYEAHAGGAGAGNLLSTRYFFFWALATSWELAFFFCKIFVSKFFFANFFSKIFFAKKRKKNNVHVDRVYKKKSQQNDHVRGRVCARVCGRIWRGFSPFTGVSATKTFFHSSFIVLTETKFSFRCIPVGIGTLLQYVPDAGYFS